MRTAENDFEGTRTTIPWVRDATGQGCDWGAFVRVHTGRGQDTCIREQAPRTRRTPTASGVDCVKTVGRARDSLSVCMCACVTWCLSPSHAACICVTGKESAVHAQGTDGQWSRWCEDGGSRKRCEDGGARRWRRTEQSDPSQARRTRRTPTASGVDGVQTVGGARGVKTAGRARGAAHTQDADVQWSRRCEDCGSRQRCEDGGSCRWRRNEQSDWALLLRTRRTTTVSGIDGVKTVGCARGVKTVGCAGSSVASKASPSGVPWTRWRCP